MRLILGLALASIIGVVHFFGEEIDERLPENSFFFASFSAGFTVSYLFLSMLPKISEALTWTEYEFLFVLTGFSMFYVVEELIYERDTHMANVKKDFKELHSGFLFSYYFVVGFLIYFLLGQGFSEAFLFFLPVLLHTAVNSLALKEMHEDMLENLRVKFAVSFAAIFGALSSYIIDPSSNTAYSMFGLIGGMFIYVVIHDSLRPRTERPAGFVTGVSLFVLLISLV